MESTVPKSTSRVIKKLDPQAPGARQWAATYGEQLVSVRYRVDQQRQRRQTTVEIVVDEAPTLNSVRVGVRVAWGEKEVARKAREASGTWDPNAKLWMMTLGQAKETGLVDRVVMGAGK
jgi:hypothetical protein